MSVPDEVVKVPRLLELVPFTHVYTGRDSAQRGEGERGLFFAIIYIVRALVFFASLQTSSFLDLVFVPSASVTRPSKSGEIAGTVKREEVKTTK